MGVINLAHGYKNIHCHKEQIINLTGTGISQKPMEKKVRWLSVCFEFWWRKK